MVDENFNISSSYKEWLSEVEYALRGITNPLGVEFSYTEMLPEELKSSFPSVEEMEEELNKIE